MTPKKIKLRENVNFYYYHENRFSNNNLCVEFLRPLEKSECASLELISMLLRRGGTNKYPDIASLSKAKEENYDCSAGTGVVRDANLTGLGFSVSWLDGSFVPDGTDTEEGALDILAQIMLCPKSENGAFPTESLEREKKNLCDKIRSLINNRERYASTKCREMMYENDPFGAPSFGCEEDVAAADAKGLFALYRQIIECCPINVFYIGHAAEEKAKKSVEALLMPILDFSRDDYPAQINEEIAPIAKEKSASVKMSGSQSILCLGLKTPITSQNDDFLAHKLCWAILSGSSINKFYRRVREAYSLCYFCYGATDALKGAVIVSTGINACDRALAEEKIREQIEDMKIGNISDEEFEAGKKALRSGLRETNDSLFATENYYIRRIRASLPIDVSPEMMMEKLEALTVSDVMRAAISMKYDSVFFLEGDGIEDDESESEGGDDE